MKKSLKNVFIIIITILSIVLVSLIIIITILYTKNKVKFNSIGVSQSTNRYQSKYEKNDEKKVENIEVNFTRTLSVDAKLKYLDSTGKYGYVVVNQFQKDMPTVMKIEKELFDKVIVNNYYEFNFYGYANTNNDYNTLYDIVNNFKLISIDKTDKTGLEQRQDSIF